MQLGAQLSTAIDNRLSTTCGRSLKAKQLEIKWQMKPELVTSFDHQQTK